MTGFGDRPSDRPTHELLAAYADGELDPAGRARVEAWLAAHPEAWADLETQRRFSAKNQKLWRPTAGPNPGESGWTRVLAGVHRALLNPPQPAAPTPRRRWYGYAAAASTAAVALVAFGLLQPPAGEPVTAVAVIPVEVFPVADDADVEIVSLPAADADLIVVGRMPLDGPIVLATFADVTLINVAKDTDGMMPIVQMQAGPNAPMIIAPMPGR